MTVPQSRADELARFRDYRRDGDREQRDALVAEHQQLARMLARRFQHRGEELDDLYQVAMLGLLKAVERFDPSMGYAFSTFAAPTILGELKRHFRGQWTVRVPRSLQESALDVARAVDELSQSLGRSPTVTEIARQTGYPEEVILESMEAARAFRTSTLERPDPSGSEHSMLETLGERERGMEAVEQRVAAERLLQMLDQRERSILRMRFLGGLTQAEIGREIGLSQMHVSRLIARSLDRLRSVADLELEDLEVR
jgi:RNA polymerase sigma-B factor